MESIDYFRCRNIELETELRLVKEQLAQAQRGTQYLINCLSNQHPQPHDQTAKVQRTETTHSQPANTENDPLRLVQHFTNGICDSITSQQSSSCLGDTDCVESNHLSSAHRSNELSQGDFTQPPEEDLLDLQDQPHTPSAATVSSTAISSSRACLTGSSLIDSAIDTPLTPFTPPYGRQDVFSSGSEAEPIGLGILDFDGTDQDLGEWRPCRSPFPVEPVLIFNRPFADHEHNRLMGSAVFVEDMTEEEQTEHWVEFARKNSRHSAEEWKLYYDQVVRPAYLAKIDTQGIGKTSEAEIMEDRLVDSYKDGPKAIGEVRPDQDPAASISALKEQDNRFVDAAAHTNGAEHSDHIDNLTIPGDSGDSGDGTQLDELVAAHSAATTPSDIASSGPDGEVKQGAEVSQSSAHEQSVAISPSRPRYFGPPKGVSDLLFNITSTKSTLFRTVLITNVPSNATLSEIVSRVHGGKIVSATFLKTAGMKTKPPLETNAVMIVFLAPQRARAYVDFRKDSPIVFSCSKAVDQVKANVELVKTPSRPLHPKLLADFQNGLSRALFIIDEKSHWRIDEILVEFTRCGIRTPLNAGRDKDGILFFEFANARDAGAAWAVVDRHHWFFHDASKGFLPDPCDQPFEDTKGRMIADDAKAEERTREDDGESESED